GRLRRARISQLPTRQRTLTWAPRRIPTVSQLPTRQRTDFYRDMGPRPGFSAAYAAANTNSDETGFDIHFSAAYAAANLLTCVVRDISFFSAAYAAANPSRSRAMSIAYFSAAYAAANSGRMWRGPFAEIGRAHV